MNVKNIAKNILLKNRFKIDLMTNKTKDGKVELQYEKVSDEEAAIIDAKIKAAEKADEEGK